MPSEDRIKDLFHRSLAIPKAKRTAFVQEQAGSDAVLMTEVLSLLKHVSSESVETGPIPNSRIESLPDSIGHYKILGLLGEGGFGVVYEAEQSVPVKRRVALKIIKAGMDSKSVVARFEAERQALAVMDHPCVAKIFDGGVTEPEHGSRPYFAMELVRGEPITGYCDKNRLSIGARVELFKKVCEAVQHAHSKGVIHRDIKPGNIMVAHTDDGPMPKVIDFGVAKAINQRLTEDTIFTEQGQVIGTPEYMSPEQAEMAGTDIDTRSDIYSLGVVLYELLSGRRPFDAGVLRKAAMAEVQRIIREEDPPRPSTRVSTAITTDAELASKMAKARQSEPRQLEKRLRGELDWVVMKCLAKERERRYESASGLASELGRYLEGDLVRARPPSRVYRARKFARKNKATVTAAAAIAIILALSTIVSGAALRSTRIEKSKTESALQAESEALKKEQAARAQADLFLQNLERLVGAFHDFEREIHRLEGGTRARQVLADSAFEVLEEIMAIPDRPGWVAQQAAGWYLVVGKLSLISEGTADNARRSFERAFDLYSDMDDGSDQRRLGVLDARIGLVRAEVRIGNTREALAQAAVVLADIREMETPDNELRDQLNRRMASALEAQAQLHLAQRRYDLALDSAQEAASIWSELSQRSAHDPQILEGRAESLLMQAEVLVSRKPESAEDVEQAVEFLIEARNDLVAAIGLDSSDLGLKHKLLKALHHLGRTTAAMARFRQGEARTDLYHQALSIFEDRRDRALRMASADPADRRSRQALAVDAFERAMVAIKAGDFELAAQLATDAQAATQAERRSDPTSLFALRREGLAYEIQAKVLFTQHSRKSSDPGRTPALERASSLYSEASRVFAELVKRDPDLSEYQTDLARSLSLHAKSLELCLNAEPPSETVTVERVVETYRAAALAYERSGNHSWFERETHARTVRSFATVLFRVQGWQESLDMFEFANGIQPLTENKQLASEWGRQAYAHFNLGEIDECIRLCERAFELMGETPFDNSDRVRDLLAQAREAD